DSRCGHEQGVGQAAAPAREVVRAPRQVHRTDEEVVELAGVRSTGNAVLLASAECDPWPAERARIGRTCAGWHGTEPAQGRGRQEEEVERYIWNGERAAAHGHVRGRAAQEVLVAVHVAGDVHVPRAGGRA